MKDNISIAKIKIKKVKKYYGRYIGNMALLCPCCYEIHMININKKIKYHIKDNNKIFASMKFNGICKHCHKPVDFIEIDGNLGKTIKTLNRKGYTTKFCCEGHDKVENKNDKAYNAYIYFDNGIMYLDIIKKFLPNSWYIDQGDLKDKKFIIRAKRDIPLKKRINDIQEMAKKLGDLKYID